MNLLLRLLSRNFDDLRIRQKLFRINLLLLGLTAVVIVVFFPAVPLLSHSLRQQKRVPDRVVVLSCGYLSL